MIYHTASHCTVCITTDVVKSYREQCGLGWANQQIVDTMYSDRDIGVEMFLLYFNCPQTEAATNVWQGHGIKQVALVCLLLKARCLHVYGF